MDYNMFSSCEKFDVKNADMDCVVKQICVFHHVQKMKQSSRVTTV